MSLKIFRSMKSEASQNKIAKPTHLKHIKLQNYEKNNNCIYDISSYCIRM